MPALKTPCPECDATMRFTVAGPGDHEVTCLKCGHEFTATLEPDEAPSGTKEKKKAGAADDAPKKKKKKKAEAENGNQKLIAGAGVGLLLALGLGLVIYAATRDKDKTASTTGTPPATTTDAPQPSTPQPPAAPRPNTPATNPNPSVPPKQGTATNPGTNPPPKKNKPEEVELATMLPPPPKIRVNESMVPATKPLVVAPAVPPLAPDEDPFVRAESFKPEGTLPTLPPPPKTGGRPLLTLDSGGHTGFVGKVFFTPKGDQIITVGEDKAVRFWDPVSNETVKTIRFPAGPGREGSLQAAALSRSGKRLAVAGHKLAGVAAGKVPIYIISPETGNQVTRFDVGSGDAVSALHFSNDGSRLAVGCEDGTVQLLDASGRVVGRRTPHSGAPVIEVRYNPNPRSNAFASLGADQSVVIWDLGNDLRFPFAVVGAIPSCLAWSADGRTLALGTTTGQIMIGNAQGQPQRTLAVAGADGKPIKLKVSQIQFTNGDRDLVVAGAANGAGWAGVVSPDTGVVRTVVTGHTNTVFAVDASAEGDRVVSSGGNRHETLIWGTTDGKIQHQLVGTGAGVWAVGWAKDGKSIAWGTSNKRGPNNTGTLEHTFRLDEFGLGNAPDPSKYTQTVDSDEHVKVLTLPIGMVVQTTGRQPIPILLDGDRIYSATVLPKANAVLAGGAEHLYLVTPSTGRKVKTFVGHTGNVLCVTPSPDSRYFATGSSDQTIRIWHRDRDEPVLSIFVAGREWIAWTPQGFYACSPQGERLIAWQINTSNVKFPQIHPAGRFRATMYQPAMLKYLIPAGDLSKAMAMAQKYDQALIQTTNVADVLPPEVTLSGFTEGTELKMDKAKDTLVVKATASSNPNAKHPITAMRLLVDGRPFNGAAGVKRFETPQPTAEATWEVPLAPGSHTVAVIADSPVSKGMSKVGLVQRAGEVPKPNLYVLAMGVSAYPGKLKLNYCATDAEMLTKAFQDKSREVFNKIEVKVLTDRAAGRQGIRDGLAWMKSKMTPQDVGIVSFSGHGTRDPFGRFYLVPFVESDPTTDPSEWALSGDEFKKRLEDMPGRLVAILDACHSGSVAEKDGPPPADTLVRDLTAEDSGVIVMCASLGREYAAESPICKAGFFTLGLVEGLGGHADVDGDGVIYIHELDLYATTRVRQLSGGRQNPTLGRPPAVKPFVIAKPGKQAAP